ncbi:MAG: hypothetical protein ACTSVL_10560 [Promethearchaeota archaeon]
MELKIKSLEEELNLLTEDLDAADEEVESLNQKLHNFEQKALEGFYLPKASVLKVIKSILMQGLHTIILTTPNIEDIKDLELFEVKPSVNIKVATWIDPSNPDHQEILRELTFDNIMIRIDDFKDRYCILKDGAELFLGIEGKKEDEILTLRTKDSKHIKFLSALVMESWLRARKLKKME